MSARLLRFVPIFVLFLVPACSVGTGTRPDSGAGGDAEVGDAGEGSGDAGARDAGAPTDAGPLAPGCQLEEICDNGVDDNCDGTVEEGCACVPGTVAPCFRRISENRGLGTCADGTMVCTDGLEFGTWGECTGDTIPATEACDEGLLDEDCDGASNEGCECVGTEPTPCGSSEGACNPGQQLCIDGMRGECTGGTGPLAEVCNNSDDDCDGATDEGVSRGCGTATGECTTGIEVCVMGAFEGCTGRTGIDEICDGLDNDCDGDVDESLSRGCGSAMGECTMGTQTCSGGAWGTCGGETLPTVETCNNLDDDCDGVIDNGVTRGCGSSTGICTPGTQTCSMGGWGDCTGGVSAGTELCNPDGLDENCDGAVNEGCGCTDGTYPCGTDEGECVAGTQLCTGGVLQACVGQTTPVPEECNGLDDDCDTMIDEMGVCPTTPPVVTCPGGATTEVLVPVSLAGGGSDPDGGSVTYAWTVTARPIGSTAQPSSPSSSSTNFTPDLSGSYTLRLCVTDDEAETRCCTTSVTATPPGAIHVEVTWDTPYGDVDVHVLNVTSVPDAGWFTTEDCYWATCPTGIDWPPTGADSNPTLDIDDTDGNGPENVTIDRNPASGTYSIGVHYYCEHSLQQTGEPPINTGSGATEARVQVFCDGALIATYTGVDLTSTDDWVTVGEVAYPSCVGMSVDDRTTGNEILLLNPANTFARHCDTSGCTGDGDCLANERCARLAGGGPPRYQCILAR